MTKQSVSDDQGRPRAARAAKNDMLTLEIYIDIDEEGIG